MSNDYTIMRRAMFEPHWRRIEWKPEAIDVRGAPYSDVLPEPVTLNIRKPVLRELVYAEEGAYEDTLRGNTGRPLHAHVHKIAQRYTGRLVIRTYAEAEDAYYAVCSGTFSIRSRACFNAAMRIATALRPYASPETVKLFPISGIEAP
jgi:hypothetical protein